MKPIQTEEEYQAALRMIEPYFDNQPIVNSIEGDRFEMLLMVIEAYEAKLI